MPPVGATSVAISTTKKPHFGEAFFVLLSAADPRRAKTVTLLNLERPTAWDEVSDWVDRHGSIANADVVRIAKVDTLKASKMLAAWREDRLLVPLPDRGKRNMAYAKPMQAAQDPLFSELDDNNA